MTETAAAITLKPTLESSLKPSRQRYLIAAILLVVVFFSFIDRVNISVLIVDNAFLTYMGIVGQSVQKGLLMTFFLIPYGFGNVLLGPLGDAWGPRKAMSLACVGWVISLIIGGLATTFAVVLFARIILGLCEGMHFPMQSTYVKAWFPPQERGKANAIWSVGMSIAPAIAMPFFAWLIYYTGWRESFFVLAGLGLVPLAAIWFLAPDRPTQSKWVNESERTYILEGLRHETEEEAKQQKGKTGFWDGVRAFAGNYNFWLLVFYYVVHTSVFWGMTTWLPSYLKEARGFSWAAMGALSSLPFVVMIVSKMLSGYLCDKLGRQAPLLLIAMVGTAVGISLGAEVSDKWTCAVFLALAMGCLGLGAPASWTLLQKLAPAKGVSTGAGIMNGVGNGLSSLAPLAIGLFISITGSYSGGLYYLVGCCALSAVATLILTLRKY